MSMNVKPRPCESQTQFRRQFASQVPQGKTTREGIARFALPIWICPLRWDTITKPGIGSFAIPSLRNGPTRFEHSCQSAKLTRFRTS